MNGWSHKIFKSLIVLSLGESVIQAMLYLNKKLNLQDIINFNYIDSLYHSNLFFNS